MNFLISTLSIAIGNINVVRFYSISTHSLEDALTVINAYNVVLHSYPISNNEILKKVKEKIHFYLPELIILEDAECFGSRKGKHVRRAISKIEKYAQSEKLNVSKYSRNDISFVFNSFNAHSKYEIA